MAEALRKFYILYFCQVICEKTDFNIKFSIDLSQIYISSFIPELRQSYHAVENHKGELFSIQDYLWYSHVSRLSFANKLFLYKS